MFIHCWYLHDVRLFQRLRTFHYLDKICSSTSSPQRTLHVIPKILLLLLCHLSQDWWLWRCCSVKFQVGSCTISRVKCARTILQGNTTASLPAMGEYHRVFRLMGLNQDDTTLYQPFCTLQLRWLLQKVHQEGSSVRVQGKVWGFLCRGQDSP